MNNTKPALPAVALLLSDSRGVFIPQHFVTQFHMSEWQGITPDDIQTLTSGPDDEFYWEAWDSVLNSAKHVSNGNTWRLMQDGDLWAYCLELMSDEEKHNFRFDEE